MTAAGIIIFIILSVASVLPASFTSADLSAMFYDGLHSTLSSFLLAYPLITIIVGLILSALVIVLPKPANWVLLFLYLVFILYITILFRTPSDTRNEIEIFYSYQRFFSSYYYRCEILQNIWLFIPFGTALYAVSKKVWVIVFAFALSVLIEGLQYFLCIGICEVDDVISNTFGALIGIGIGYLLYRKRKYDV